MRLQPSPRQLTPCEDRRQTYYPQLWFGHAGVCCLRREVPSVCLLPGTELSFADEVRRESSLSPWSEAIKYKTAIFRQVNKHNPRTHHDALEFPDGETVLLTLLKPDQQATVLQLPASTSGSNGAQRAEEPAMAR